jgi:hypothetical protein
MHSISKCCAPDRGKRPINRAGGDAAMKGIPDFPEFADYGQEIGALPEISA